MDEIIIKKENMRKIQEAIDTAQKRSRTRTIEAKDVFEAVEDVEGRISLIPKCDWNEIKASVNVHAQRFARCYRGCPMSTIFTIVYRSGDWRLTDVHRDICKNRYLLCDIPAEVEEKAEGRYLAYLEHGYPV